MTPTISPTAMAMASALVRAMEGFSAKPYRDSTGTWTIGTGLTRLNGKPITAATPAITPAQDDAALTFEFGRTVALIQRSVSVPLDDGQAAALISECFNCGAAPLTKGSTELAMLNAGRYSAAADQMPVWCHSKGVVLGGLQDRRQIERAVFLGLIDPRDTAALNAFHTAVTHARQAGKPVPVPAGGMPAVKPAPALAKPIASAAPAADTADALMATELEQLGADDSTT
jgi:lysozyme